MANALGFSYGDVQRNIESIKTARVQRESAQEGVIGQRLDNDAKREAVGDRATARTNSANMLGLRARAVSGDKAAKAELVAVNPDEASDFLKALGTLNEQELAEQQKGIEYMGTISMQVLQAPDPAAEYASLLERMPPEVAEQLPPVYDETFVKAQLAKATEYDTLVDDFLKTRSNQTERVEDEAADIRADERAHQYKVKEAKVKAAIDAGAAGQSAGGREMKSADTNSVYRQSVAFFDGIFGPDGEVRLTDPKDAAKLQNLAKEASKLWASGTMTHAEAVAQAADALGYGLGDKSPGPAADPAAAADPLGLFSGG